MQTEGVNGKYSLEEIKNTIKQYMQIENENDFIIDLIIATAISLNLERPVWLMIVAPSSSGKTELLRTIEKVKGFHLISNITDHFLLSGHREANGGYMNRQVGKKGILAFKDFTTVLEMSSTKRNSVMSQLRVIHDGDAGLGTGMDIDKTKMWKGKVAIIVCVTDVIETQRHKTADVGDRFLYYRFNPSIQRSDFNYDIPELAKKKKCVKKIAKSYIEQKQKDVTSTVLNSMDQQFVYKLAEFIAAARTTVPRDSYNREIIDVPRPEEPHRLIISLSSLYKALICMHSNNKERSITILKEIAKSSIPHLRWLILKKVFEAQQEVTIQEIIHELSLPETTVRRLIEDLIVLKILHSSGNIRFESSKKVDLQTEFKMIMNQGIYANLSVPEKV